jgi:hypothetical protein
MRAIASMTAWRLSSDTLAVPFNIRDTVLGETPAKRATSMRVVGLSFGDCSLKWVPSYLKNNENLFKMRSVLGRIA